MQKCFNTTTPTSSNITNTFLVIRGGMTVSMAADPTFLFLYYQCGTQLHLIFEVTVPIGVVLLYSTFYYSTCQIIMKYLYS